MQVSAVCMCTLSAAAGRPHQHCTDILWVVPFTIQFFIIRHQVPWGRLTCKAVDEPFMVETQVADGTGATLMLRVAGRHAHAP